MLLPPRVRVGLLHVVLLARVFVFVQACWACWRVGRVGVLACSTCWRVGRVERVERVEGDFEPKHQRSPSRN